MNSRNVLQQWRNSPLAHAALLGAFALVAATLLAAGALLTREAIEHSMAEDLKQSLRQVVPDALYDTDLLRDTVSIVDENGETRLLYRARKEGRVSAVAYELSGKGYSGTIRVLMGVDREGQVLGVRVLSHSETPGLGDKIEIRKSGWILGFDGASLNNPPPDAWKVKKDGGRFDQFSGATITPRAVVDIVKKGLAFFSARRVALLDEGPGERR